MSGTRLGGEETEDLKRAVSNKTMDDHRLDINEGGNGAMTSGQPRKMNKRIGREDEKDEEKKDKGAGLSAKMEVEGAGRNNDVYKDEGAGLSAKKDKGAGRNKCRAQGKEREDTINPRDDVYKSDRNKGDRNKNGYRNTDDRYKANSKIKECQGQGRGLRQGTSGTIGGRTSATTVTRTG